MRDGTLPVWLILCMRHLGDACTADVSHIWSISVCYLGDAATGCLKDTRDRDGIPIHGHALSESHGRFGLIMRL